jgi:hypothetical protein
LYSLFIAYRGWVGGRAFTKTDDQVRHWTATIAHIQLLLGLSLYAISPTVRYFLSNYKEAIHDREFRFFGMEHITIMVSAVIVITIGSMLAKRKTTDRDKFKNMALGYTIGLLLILSSIPWPFSPLVSRPWLRWL